jgi:hypothetical protein
VSREAECRPGEGGIPDDALGGDNVSATVQADAVSGRNWRELWGPARAEAIARSAERRQLVLAHEDLAAMLTRPPVGFRDPKQWTGYVPPRIWNGSLNMSPQRKALAAICALALERQAGDCPALDVT